MAFRSDRSEAAAEGGLGQIADHLAVAVRRQWEAEARVRRLNDPYPLPVSWTPVQADLAEDWARLESTAFSWPGGPLSDRSGWSTGPGELAGTDGEIAEVLLQRVPTRRLVVLGAPGSGKTMLLVRMLLTLVEQRSSGGAVPVLFSLSSWNPVEQELDDWLIEQLIQDYEGLRESAPGSLERTNCAQALLTHRLVLPVLDGFDEIPAAVRTAALDRINAALPLGQSVVLSSRVQEYREALHPISSIPSKLAGAAGVELQPVEPQVAADYLSSRCRTERFAWRSNKVSRPGGLPVARA
ncbi:NACHT domain-containing protein [Streptomyces sp. NPDC055186]